MIEDQQALRFIFFELQEALIIKPTVAHCTQICTNYTVQHSKKVQDIYGHFYTRNGMENPFLAFFC